MAHTPPLPSVSVARGPVPAASAGELKERLELERGGIPFLAYRDDADRQVLRRLDSDRLTVGRDQAADLPLPFDQEVSRVHAELVRMAGGWTLVDDGLSRNGTYVNGERVVGRRRLADGDALRFGSTVALFRAPGEQSADTRIATASRRPPDLSGAQRRVLTALCRPYAASGFATPATNRQIAAELYLSVDAVKSHLRTLFEKFEVGELPQNQKRARLADLALKSGAVSARDWSGSATA
jgi:pSer/pThr/pTyr-binding forkhead associated (FHA) protein